MTVSWIGAAMTPLSTVHTPCRLYDAAGELLSAGWCTAPAAPMLDEEVTVTGLDRPGTVVRYCLLNGARDVLLQVGEGPQTPMKVVRVSFDPHRGRICLLRPAPAPVEPAATRSGATLWGNGGTSAV
jgi:hypothetical protein